MKIRDIKQLITDAERLEAKLIYIEAREPNIFENSQEIIHLLETDSSTFNMEALEEYVKYNTESIELKYKELTKDEEDKPRTLAELKHIHTAFEIDWKESEYCDNDDYVAKREEWMNWLDALTTGGEITEKECEDVLAVII